MSHHYYCGCDTETACPHPYEISVSRAPRFDVMDSMVGERWIATVRHSTMNRPREFRGYTARGVERKARRWIKRRDDADVPPKIIEVPRRVLP